ncbi:YqzK family protein [Evansella sp. LMS18]|uniref:YqzK family protein n=1 Tax=Evansella sp. LMS18 TaxID=2924033 RepID=UPI0020D01493|nr:YqzK family protein [Evansella sp. LMS18]UTR09544.1 YqzK family protein [Evansella sp. LMS18]
MKHVKTVWEAIFVFFLFMGCTLVFYYGILWVSEEYKDYHRYGEPEGRAVKVLQQDSGGLMNDSSVWRLKYFLNHGE